MPGIFPKWKLGQQFIFGGRSFLPDILCAYLFISWPLPRPDYKWDACGCQSGRSIFFGVKDCTGVGYNCTQKHGRVRNIFHTSFTKDGIETGLKTNRRSMTLVEDSSPENKPDLHAWSSTPETEGDSCCRHWIGSTKNLMPTTNWGVGSLGLEIR